MYNTSCLIPVAVTRKGVALQGRWSTSTPIPTYINSKKCLILSRCLDKAAGALRPHRLLYQTCVHWLTTTCVHWLTTTCVLCLTTTCVLCLTTTCVHSLTTTYVPYLIKTDTRPLRTEHALSTMNSPTSGVNNGPEM